MAYILYYMAIVGHALSIASLLISLVIFFYFRYYSFATLSQSLYSCCLHKLVLMLDRTSRMDDDEQDG